MFHTFCGAKLLLFFDMCKSLRYFLLKIVYFIAVLRPVLVTFVASPSFFLKKACNMYIISFIYNIV